MVTHLCISEPIGVDSCISVNFCLLMGSLQNDTIYSLFVDPDPMRKEIGTKLMQKFEEIAKNHYIIVLKYNSNRILCSNCLCKGKRSHVSRIRFNDSRD